MDLVPARSGLVQRVAPRVVGLDDRRVLADGVGEVAKARGIAGVGYAEEDLVRRRAVELGSRLRGRGELRGGDALAKSSASHADMCLAGRTTN